MSRKVRAQAADRDVWDPEAQWAYMSSCVVDELTGLAITGVACRTMRETPDSQIRDNRDAETRPA